MKAKRAWSNGRQVLIVDENRFCAAISELRAVRDEMAAKRDALSEQIAAMDTILGIEAEAEGGA